MKDAKTTQPKPKPIALNKAKYIQLAQEIQKIVAREQSTGNAK